MLRGITRGAKGAVTSVVRAIRDGDTIEVLSYFCRIADESIGGVLKGATTSLDGVHDGLGAVLDTAAATMTRVPVAGDVAGGGVNAARHVLSAAFGAVRGVDPASAVTTQKFHAAKQDPPRRTPPPRGDRTP